FEQTVLADLRARGVVGRYVFLLEVTGSPADLVARDGAAAATYAHALTHSGLDRLAAAHIDGISVDKRILLRADGPSLVAAAHARDLTVFTWTCRPENAFLDRRFRASGGTAAFGDFHGEWARLALTGLDGVFVDHADLGVEAFRG
ncbi:MAG: glycerophosphodiester phosphodiesterase, partial [Actinobacteria bacterium]|nr:glycerophosphodiester phosphodiesterase [Actinomycetota bacterium]